MTGYRLASFFLFFVLFLILVEGRFVQRDALYYDDYDRGGDPGHGPIEKKAISTFGNTKQYFNVPETKIACKSGYYYHEGAGVCLPVEEDYEYK